VPSLQEQTISMKQYTNTGKKYLATIISASTLFSCSAIEIRAKESKEPTEIYKLQSQYEKYSMLSEELENSLSKVFGEANEKNYESVSVEQLLLVLLENPSAAQVLRMSGLEFNILRTGLVEYIDNNAPKLSGANNREIKPTAQFQRVLQRSVWHVQSAEKNEVVGSDVLYAIFGEPESHAVKSLHSQSITRLDVLNNRKALSYKENRVNQRK